MSKFNSTATRSANTAVGPIKTKAGGKLIKTHEGADGARRDTRSELFLLAVSNMVGEPTFYEAAGDRDDRYRTLIRKMAVKDGEWTAALLGWLRGPEANMRSASIVGAAEYVKGRLDAGISGGNRDAIRAVLQRADEPGEMLAYWTANYGRRLPQPVKRGVADAVTRLYTERSLLKYDTASHGWRFADVIDLVHPTAKDDRQGDLFEHALDRRHNRDNEIPASLLMVRDNAALRAMGPNRAEEFLFGTHDLHDNAADALNAAGMTWESVPSLLGGAWTAKRWEAIIPSMGYMALLRNLRNLDQAGVSDAVAQQVMAKLTDPSEVAKSRQFPFRFLSAYEAAPSLRWGHSLDKALGHALRNIPKLPGRTLILIDTSGSMTGTCYSARSKVTPLKAAAVFGVALGAANPVGSDIYGFASGEFKHDVPAGASAIAEIQRFVGRAGEVGHGTDIAGAVRRQYKGHDRVFIISDMQTQSGGITAQIPKDVPVYGFNLGGYRPGAYALGPNRHEFGSLTDSTFKLVPLLEAGHSGAWPWLIGDQPA
ncbi:TROVE domain-containing protein [Nocardia sp. NPDC056611]|uniref:TROVE domain-containing protein n=1 Tax=Nocardia sp. NPDC056611 TaxID=3345877 RepID=UPI00366F59D9